MLRSACIFDIDGTLADIRHRVLFVAGPKKDYETFYSLAPEDPPYPWMIDLVKTMSLQGNEIIFLTARPEHQRAQTVAWLEKHVLFLGESVRELLFMRPNKDFRPDFEIKREVFYRDIWPKFLVKFVVDDSGRVCEMFRSIGVPALQCRDREAEERAVGREREE